MTHPVAQAILERRSWRIYMDTPLEDSALEVLQRAADLAPTVRGRRAGHVEFVAEPQRARVLTRAITRGFLGKTNFWLASAPPQAYAVVVGDTDRSLKYEDRYLYNVDVAVAGELVCLAAAARKLGSCWMAAIHMDNVASFLGLGESGRVPAAIAIGEPGIRRKGALLASGWQRFTSRNKRRRTMAEIVHAGSYGSGHTLPGADLAACPVDGRDLLDVIGDLTPSSTFTGQPPSEDQLSLVMEAVRIAPSADNAQTWRFVLLRGDDEVSPVLDAAGEEATGELCGATMPGALLAVGAAPFIIRKVHSEQPFALIDHPIALTHAILMAEVLGLHWNAWFAFDHEAVQRACGFPSNHPVTALLALDTGGERATAPYPEWVQLHR